MKCLLPDQGVPRGDCLTTTLSGEKKQACDVTLRKINGMYERLIKSIHLSRPEDYLSVYSSGCNHNCLKCHSSEFSKNMNGKWINIDMLAVMASDYCRSVTVEEPRSRATMWHAEDLCFHCGSCILYGIPSDFCPRKLSPKQIVPSPQGLGPARNIIAFTGGDLTCNPHYYALAAEKIKMVTDEKLWVLIETNGYALTKENLKILRDGGVDSFWLDIKAYDETSYRKLCGTPNSTVLDCLSLMVDLDFTVEVLTLFIPGIVETDQHKQIARLIVNVDSSIPTTLLAFFPSYKLLDHRSPTFDEMMTSYGVFKEEGLENLRLGNIGVFAKTDEQVKVVQSLR
ncbi:MAG: radical SAM protein [Candidatus Hodarchaeales archaeon]|jgi:pyruvate-formate lyase-activating enzyme